MGFELGESDYLSDDSGPITLDNGESVVIFSSPNIDATVLVTHTDGSVTAAGHVIDGTSANWALARFGPGGGLDQDFGTNGVVVTDLGSDEDFLHGASVDPQGRIVAVGETIRGGNHDTVVVRYTRTGMLDATFGDGGIAMFSLSTSHDRDDRGFAVDASGSNIIIASYANFGHPTWEDVVVLRLVEDGSLDPDFGVAGTREIPKGDNDFPRFVKGLPDGSIVVGSTCSFNTCVQRLDASGDLDLDFGIDGTAKLSVPDVVYAQDFAIDNSRGIIAVGKTGDGTESKVFATRFDATGVLDLTFGTDGIVGLDLGIGPDESLDEGGRIYLAGSGRNTDHRDVLVTRLSPTGRLDESFGENGVLFLGMSAGGSQARDIAFQGDELVILARAGKSFAVARGDPNSGVLDVPNQPEEQLPFVDGLSSLDLASDQTWVDGTLIDTTGMRRTNPLAVKNLTVTGEATYQPGTSCSLFVRASLVNFEDGGLLQVNGENGNPPGGTVPGNGGSGGSGGGSGAVGHSGHGAFGGAEVCLERKEAWAGRGTTPTIGSMDWEVGVVPELVVVLVRCLGVKLPMVAVAAVVVVGPTYSQPAVVVVVVS